MESIANSDPIVQSELNDYKKFHLYPNLRFIAENYETYRRNAQAYADTQKMEGIAIGEVNQTIKFLIQMLEWTIAPVSEALRARIEQITDLDQLNRLYGKVLKREIHMLDDSDSHGSPKIFHRRARRGRFLLDFTDKCGNNKVKRA